VSPELDPGRDNGLEAARATPSLQRSVQSGRYLGAGIPDTYEVGMSNVGSGYSATPWLLIAGHTEADLAHLHLEPARTIDAGAASILR
jgi:hypothetical protein